MGRLFLIDLDFDEEPFRSIIVCRTCHTHIANHRDFMHLATMEGEYAPKYSKVVNVQEDGPENHWEDEPQTLANVYCVKCGELLGVKYIKDMCLMSTPGCYKMFMNKLSQWNGNIYWDLHYELQLPN